MEVIGSITLNLTVGGLYPESVSKALALDTRIVWMPTHDANHHRRYFGDSVMDFRSWQIENQVGSGQR